MSEDPENDLDLWESLTHGERKDRRGEVWIKRSTSWQGMSGLWKGVRVLGSGSYGLCGLFRYLGSDEKVPNYVVVKQSGRPDRSLQNESRLLAQCGRAKSVHVVKMYKSYHQEGGTGTSKKFDPHPYEHRFILGDVYMTSKEVSRIYLEYCSRGDVFQWMSHLASNNLVVSELSIWRVFECFARGAMVLEEGHEPNKMPHPNHRPIAHFDIKPSNILIASKDESHNDLGILKIADLGLARLVPNAQSAGWWDHAEWRFSPDYGTPEQLYTFHDKRHIGTPCNIWGIAAVIYGILMGGAPVPQEVFQLQFLNRDARLPIRTMGHPLISCRKYKISSFLMQTLFCCLAWDPADRPTARQLVELCTQAIDSLSADPSEAPKAIIGVDVDYRQAVYRDTRPREIALPRHVGDTNLGPGPKIDELNIGPGLTGVQKITSKPLWQPLPRSPLPVKTPPANSPSVSANESGEFVQAVSNQVNPGTKRHRENEDDGSDAKKGKGKEKGPLDQELSSHELFIRDLVAIEKRNLQALEIQTKNLEP